MSPPPGPAPSCRWARGVYPGTLARLLVQRLLPVPLLLLLLLLLLLVGWRVGNANCA